MHALVERLRPTPHRPRLVAFARALALPFRAAAFLAARRTLWLLAAVPALINVILFVIAAVLVLTYADTVVALLWAQPPNGGAGADMLVVLRYLLYAAVVVFGLTAAYVVTLLLSGIVASPFNDALSVRVERLLLDRHTPSPEGSFVGEAVRSVFSTAAVTLLYAILMGPVLLLNLLPGVGSLAAVVLGAGLSAFFLALEFTDITLARRRYTLREKVHLLRTHPGLATGFGLSTSLLLWIPLLNALCVPIAVVGGTALALALTAERENG